MDNKNYNGRVYATIDPSNYTWSLNLGNLISKEDKVELVEEILENEDEFMPILKKYLVGYLDKILENPEPLIKELIKEKDDKIDELSKEVSNLKKEVETLKNTIPVLPSEPIPLGPNPYYPTDPWGTGGITWTNPVSIYNAANSTTSTNPVSIYNTVNSTTSTVTV